ncbi:hypothetical protein B0H16DRAFT_1841354 [Mycena metata]|uniref:Histone-lysine N-methyltransferase, H3 lysine-79 specific n=1 Tax=Mycena metata TaxID=1033252 RepID=A0AAD7IWZ6_9AGAR|nr:hypothetical protein B0H16DRAFT_1841354 [Mycena metata]
MPPVRTLGDVKCPGPASGVARILRLNTQEELDAALFTTLDDRINFLDLAYTSLVSPHVNCVNGKIKSDVFGELLEPTLAQICTRGNLGPQSKFLDIGGGIGAACLSLGLRSGCHSVSLEKAEAPSKLAVPLHRAVFRKCSREDRRIGHHQFINADVRELGSSFTEAISSATCILCNNLGFEQDCETPPAFLTFLIPDWSSQVRHWIEAQLRTFAQPGTHLFVTHALMLGKTRRGSGDPEIFQELTFNGLCSWTPQNIPVYHYVFLGTRSADITAASPHPAALPGDDNWYPAYPPNELTCAIAGRYFYYAVPSKIGPEVTVSHCRESWKDGQMREEKLQTGEQGAHWVSKPSRHQRARMRAKKIKACEKNQSLNSQVN